MRLSTDDSQTAHFRVRRVVRALGPHARASTLASVLALAFVLAPSMPALAAPCASGATCPQQLHPDTARGLALGSGARASAISTSALAYNPAGLALGRLYHIEGMVDYLPEFRTVGLGAAAVDSSTSKVAAGIAFRGYLSGKDGIGGFDGRLALAFPFSDAVSIGLGGRYMNLSQEREVTTSTGGTALQELELAQGFTMDASLRVTPAENFHFSFAALNFVDLQSAYVPVLLATSAAIGVAEIVTIGADFLVDVTTFADPSYLVGGGVEVLTGDAVPLRGGYVLDVEREIHAISAGVGYTDRAVGFDVSLQQQVSGGSETRVIGALRYHVQ